MRIAVSSQNFRTVTGHAGQARRFIVFEADGQETPREIERLDLDRNMAIHGYDHSAGHPLDSMNVLITGSAGEGFVRHLGTRGVQVVATGESVPELAVSAFLAVRVKAPDCNENHGDDHDKKGGTHGDGQNHICNCHS